MFTSEAFFLLFECEQHNLSIKNFTAEMSDMSDIYDESPTEDDVCGDDSGEPATKKARFESSSSSCNIDSHRAEFIECIRPTVVGLPDTIEFMLIDAECVTAKIRCDMDDPSADHSPVVYADVPSKGRYKRQSASPFIIGPVIKLYGVCANGTSVCVDVYGYYPSFRMQVVRGTPSDGCLARVRNYVERTVLCPKDGLQPDKPRNVVGASMIRAFSAFPYRVEPSVFYEFKLARPQCVRAMAEHFVKVREFDDDYSEGGVFGFIPHSGEDALTQYVVDSGIAGFGWVSVSGLLEPSDTTRAESESSPCSYAGDCGKQGVKTIESRDDIAPLRVIGIDIECIKTEGMPDPRHNPIIIIGTITCEAINGVIVPDSMRNIVFTWFLPGSGGVDAIPSVHRVIATDNEIDMVRAFGKFMTAFDPDMIVGHNITGFDIPYIVTRANTLGAEEAMYMGRKRDFRWSAPREITRVRKNGDTRKSLRADTPGRVQLDTLSFMQGARKESSYKLGSLAKKYLKDNKDDVGYQMIGPLWKQSPQTRARLCAYCLKDVQLSLGLAMHKEFEMVLSVIELSRGTRVRAPQLLRSGNQEKVKTLVLHAAKDPHFDPDNLPVFFPYEVPKPRSKDDKFQGATVVNPKRGARKKSEPVAVGDFCSLYPSIMISNNMCYTTMIDVPRESPAPSNAPPHHTAPDTGTHFVKRDVRVGLLPRILEDLLLRRSRAKAMMKSDPDPAHKRMYDSRQLQLKIAANSVYGVLSASGGWFVRVEMGESVTSWGRSMIYKAMSIAKADPHNADVIYGGAWCVCLSQCSSRKAVSASVSLNRANIRSDCEFLITPRSRVFSTRISLQLGISRSEAILRNSARRLGSPSARRMPSFCEFKMMINIAMSSVVVCCAMCVRVLTNFSKRHGQLDDDLPWMHNRFGRFCSAKEGLRRRHRCLSETCRNGPREGLRRAHTIREKEIRGLLPYGSAVCNGPDTQN